MPRTFGDSNVHMSHFDKMVECNDDLPLAHSAEPTDQESRIGQFIADNLVEDGATLQMGEKRALLVTTMSVVANLCCGMMT